MKDMLLTDEEIKAKYKEFWEELSIEDLTLEEDDDALTVMRKMMDAQDAETLRLVKEELVETMEAVLDKYENYLGNTTEDRYQFSNMCQALIKIVREFGEEANYEG